MNSYIAPIEVVSKSIEKMIRKEVLLIDNEQMNPDDANVVLSFDVPNSDFVASLGSKPVINIYLYRIMQKLQNRFSENYATVNNPNNCAHLVGRRPMFVELFYAVTFWVKSTRESAFTEQILSSRLLQGLGRFQLINPEFIANEDFDPSPFGLPLAFFTEDPLSNQTEFWSSLGTPPKPLIPMSVTVPIQVHEPIEIPFTKSISRNFSHTESPDSSENKSTTVTFSGRLLNRDQFQDRKLVVKVEMDGHPEILQLSEVEYRGCYRFYDMPAGNHKYWVEDQTDPKNIVKTEPLSIILRSNSSGEVIPKIVDFDVQF